MYFTVFWILKPALRAFVGTAFSIYGHARLGSAFSVLDFVNLGSALSLRSYVRFGSMISVFGTTRLGSSLSLLDFIGHDDVPRIVLVHLHLRAAP